MVRFGRVSKTSFWYVFFSILIIASLDLSLSCEFKNPLPALLCLIIKSFLRYYAILRNKYSETINDDQWKQPWISKGQLLIWRRSLVGFFSVTKKSCCFADAIKNQKTVFAWCFNLFVVFLLYHYIWELFLLSLSDNHNKEMQMNTSWDKVRSLDALAVKQG